MLQVIVTTAEICARLMDFLHLPKLKVKLIVIDDCLYGDRQTILELIMQQYKEIPPEDAPRMLGLAGGLLGSDLYPYRLEHELQQLEKLLCCAVNTSSELVTLLRLCSRPRQRLVECAFTSALPLGNKIESILRDAQLFLEDHRYDLSEIYTDFQEEVKKIPDPKVIFATFLSNYILLLF